MLFNALAKSANPLINAGSSAPRGTAGAWPTGAGKMPHSRTAARPHGHAQNQLRSRERVSKPTSAISVAPAAAAISMAFTGSSLM